MVFDALTLAAVADELREEILDGRIQRVLLTGPLSIGLEIYARGQRHQLLASAHAQFARVHRVSGKLSRSGDHITPFLLLLRKYLLGGRLVAIEQLPLERILVLSIVKDADSRNRRLEDAPPLEADDDSFAALDAPNEDERESLHSELMIEVMDRHSNIILVDDSNRVLESIKRVTLKMSRRTMLPRQMYAPPPAQAKRDPRLATATLDEVLRASGERDLVRALVANYRGISPQAAREVVFRTLGRIDVQVHPDLPWYSLAAQLRVVVHEMTPSLVLGEQGPIAYASYLIQQLPGATRQSSISEALDRFYSARETTTDHLQRRTTLIQQLTAARERIARQYDQINGELTRANEAEQLRWEGEMILGFLHTLGTRASQLEVEGRIIQLDATRAPLEQAKERFRQYDKARSALAELPARLAEVALRLQGIDQLTTLIALNNDFAQIEELAYEAIEQGYLNAPTGQPKRRKGPRSKPLRILSSDGFEIYIGRTAQQNEEVTFRIGHTDDLWLHIRNEPGAHVIVRTNGSVVPAATLRQAAELAAYYSRQRNEVAVDIDVARRSRVRKIPSGPPGLVSYTAEQTLRVAPRGA